MTSNNYHKQGDFLVEGIIEDVVYNVIDEMDGKLAECKIIR